MTYAVGIIGSMLGDSFKYRYSQVKLIQASSKEAAIDTYRELYDPTYKAFVRCIGPVGSNNALFIPHFSDLYPSGKTLPVPREATNYYLVTRLTDSIENISDYSFYINEFIPATCAEEAIAIYSTRYDTSRFKAYCLGYLDEDDTFIVPNILDYVK